MSAARKFSVILRQKLLILTKTEKYQYLVPHIIMAIQHAFRTRGILLGFGASSARSNPSLPRRNLGVESIKHLNHKTIKQIQSQVARKSVNLIPSMGPQELS